MEESSRLSPRLKPLSPRLPLGLHCSHEPIFLRPAPLHWKQRGNRQIQGGTHEETTLPRRLRPVRSGGRPGWQQVPTGHDHLGKFRGLRLQNGEENDRRGPCQEYVVRSITTDYHIRQMKPADAVIIPIHASVEFTLDKD